VRSTGWAGVARWVGVLACALLVVCGASSSAYASGGLGIERYALTAAQEGGSADTQAGSHPYELTAEAGLDFKAQSSSEVMDLDFELPPGLIFDPNDASRCTAEEFVEGGCPNGAAVGVLEASLDGAMVSQAVYDLAPAPGEPAELGFTLEGIRMFADITVRTGGDYGMTVSIRDIPHMEVESLKLTLWGVPSDPGHDALRGSCLTGGGTCPYAGSTGAFLTLPTSCAGSLQTTLQGESWGGETASLSASFPQMAGCDLLSFEPAIFLVPDTEQAGVSAGYTLELHVPQDEEPAGLATARAYRCLRQEWKG